MKKLYIEPSLYMQAIAAELPVAMSLNQDEAGEIFAHERHERGFEEEILVDPDPATLIEQQNGWLGGLW